jgi:CO/xanthine dehydrogenase FAD-binding subunit
LRRLLDLRAFAWSSLTVTDDGLEIAATCTLAELAAFEPPIRWPAAALLQQSCEALLGSFKIWNEATVGGNICLSLPAGPMTSLAASLDGICTIWRPDGATEHIPVSQFIIGRGKNVLSGGALLRSITLSAQALGSRSAFRQFSKTALGRSAAVVIGVRSPANEITITVTAAVAHPCQLRFARPPTPAALAAALDDEPELDYFDDAHGTAEWRVHLVRLLAEEVRAELEALP